MSIFAAALALSHFRGSLEDELDLIAKESGLPGMGVSVVTSEGETWSHYYGVKKAGETDQVDASTRWHLGSCTKAMTASVICELAEEGKLDLSAPLSKVFPDFNVNAGFEKVTLRHLLAHQGGITPNINWGMLKGSLKEVRTEAMKQILESPPATEVGKYVYSNAGIVVAGVAAERATGETIETLLTEEFESLGMKSFAFGPTRKGETWPHIEGKPTDTNGDNAPVMTAAGRANMTLPDWGKWISAVLKGFNRKESGLANNYFKEIADKPLGGDYSMGWLVLSRPWAGGLALTHTGSNTMNYCTVWVAPGKDFAILITTNTAGEAVAGTMDKCVSAVIRSRN